jgi:two-component system chemotaxis response regulator CheB
MIVEDSRVVRDYLEHVIGRDRRLQVVAAVESAEEALKILARVSPDVISMDIRLPGMNGLEATRRIMAEQPTPIVVVAANVEAEDLKISISALRAGALAVVEKPVGPTHAEYEALADHLCTRLVIMSQVNVIRQRFQPRPRPAEATRRPRGTPRRPATQIAKPIRMLGIVASTGGPQAVERLLRRLGPDFPVPIALVQHITASFHRAFVEWLDDVCPLPVMVAEAGTRPQPGRVYVAPADCHLRVGPERFQHDPGEPVSLQRPSGTVLFESMAESFGPQALGVLLTGMGDDGAVGLGAIRSAGGFTIAEDETTAVIYGMPAVAVRIGAVCDCLPLDEIGARVLELVAR